NASLLGGLARIRTLTFLTGTLDPMDLGDSKDDDNTGAKRNSERGDGIARHAESLTVASDPRGKSRLVDYFRAYSPCRCCLAIRSNSAATTAHSSLRSAPR